MAWGELEALLHS